MNVRVLSREESGYQTGGQQGLQNDAQTLELSVDFLTPVSQGESPVLCPSGGAGSPPGDSPCHSGQDPRPDAEDWTIPGQSPEGGRWICPESPAVCGHQRGLEAGAGTQAAVASGDNSGDNVREEGMSEGGIGGGCQPRGEAEWKQLPGGSGCRKSA